MSHTDTFPLSPAKRRLLLGLAVGVTLAVIAGILWDTTIRDRLFPRRFGVVESGLVFRSAQLEANLVDDVLEDHGIRRIVNLGHYKPEDPREAATLAAAQVLGIPHDELGLGGDGVGDPAAYVQAIAAMVQARKRGEPVLVHCSAGVNRTGGVVALYRVFVQGWSIERAVAEMQRFDFDPSDNEALLPFLDRHYDAIAQGLVDRGILADPHTPEGSFVASK